MAFPPDEHTRVYRIVSRQYPPFDGGGAFRWGSRWISPGRHVVHAAETYALAVLENLVHLQAQRVAPTLQCVVADVPDAVSQEEIDRSQLPTAERDAYAPYREIGDDWYDSGDSAVLWVPSVVSPHERNVLIHQRHEDFTQIVVHKPVSATLDPRLWPA